MGGGKSRGKCWRVDKLDQTEPGRNSREQGGEAGLPTDVTAVRGLRGSVVGRARAGSPVFAVLDGGLPKAGPLQKRGIPASICAGGEDAVLWGIKGRAVSQKTEVFFCSQNWLPLRLPAGTDE